MKASLRYFDNQPVFRPGKCFDDCLAVGKREAKSYKRLMDKQLKKAEQDAKAAAKQKQPVRGRYAIN